MPKPPVVLLAEDQALVRMCAAEILVEDGGYRVLEAASGDEAFAMLQARRDVSVLVTDIEMPGRLDGLTLAGLAAVARPGIGIVITSGRRWPLEDEMPPEAHFLPKPSFPTQLLDAVRAVIPNQRTGPVRAAVPDEAGPSQGTVPAESAGPDLAPLTRAFADPGLGADLGQPPAKPSQD